VPAAPSDDPFDLTGRVALVTGGSRGLGREMVRAFARHGADVVISSRKIDACEALAGEVRKEFGHAALPVAANVSSWADCDRLADAAFGRFGQVDVLVNNAGMSPLYPSVDAVTEELWDKVIGVNLKGPFRLTALVGTRMVEGLGGSIINISSMTAVSPNKDVVPYAAAKAGLNSLTESFAGALGPTVRINTIMCGMFRTDIAEAWGDPAAVDAHTRRTHALGRIGEPDDIVGTALYLATDVSAYCTGATIRLDGGGGLRG